MFFKISPSPLADGMCQVGCSFLLHDLDSSLLGGLFIHKNLALGSANRYVEDETCTKPNDQTSIFDSKSNIFGWVEDPGNISEVKSYDHFDVARRIVYAYD